MPELAVLTSLSFEARLQGLEPAKYPKALAIRGSILSLLNQHLKHDHKNVYVEAIHAVLHLVQLEVDKLQSRTRKLRATLTILAVELG